MDLNKLHKELENLADTIKTTIRVAMEKYPNIKGENTLKDSDIYNELKSDAVDLDLVKVLIHDYYIFINDGSHYTSTPPPIEAILQWCKKKGIDTTNGEAWAIREAIFQRGIAARPFFDEAWEEIDGLFDDFADKVMEILLEDIDAELS